MYFDIARLFTATQGILTLFLGSFSLIIGDITIPALCMFAVSDFAIRLTKLRHLNVYESDKTVRNTLILKSLQNVPKSLQIIPEVPKSIWDIFSHWAPPNNFSSLSIFKVVPECKKKVF